MAPDLRGSGFYGAKTPDDFYFDIYPGLAFSRSIVTCHNTTFACRNTTVNSYFTTIMPDKFPKQKAEIERICRKLGMDYKQLAREAAIKEETMRRYAYGYQKISEPYMQSIRNVEKMKSGSAPLAKAVDHGSTLQEPNAGGIVAERRVPVVSWASAGRAHDYADMANQIEMTLQCATRDENAFALIVEGDSMEDEIHAGEIVIFSPNSEPRNNDIVVARLAEDHGVFLKRFRRTGKEGQTIKLISSNPAYEALEFPEKAFRFIYPAIELRRQLRK